MMETNPRLQAFWHNGKERRRIHYGLNAYEAVIFIIPFLSTRNHALIIFTRQACAQDFHLANKENGEN